MPATAMTRGLSSPEAEIPDDFVLHWPHLEDAEIPQAPALTLPDLEDAEVPEGLALDWLDLEDTEAPEGLALDWLDHPVHYGTWSRPGMTAASSQGEGQPR